MDKVKQSHSMQAHARHEVYGLETQRLDDIEVQIAAAVFRGKKSWYLKFTKVHQFSLSGTLKSPPQVLYEGEPWLLCAMFKLNSRFFVVLSSLNGDHAEVLNLTDKQLAARWPLERLERDSIQVAVNVSQTAIVNFVRQQAAVEVPPPPTPPTQPRRSTRPKTRTPPALVSSGLDAKSESDRAESSDSGEQPPPPRIRERRCNICGKSIKMTCKASLQNHMNSSQTCKSIRSLICLSIDLSLCSLCPSRTRALSPYVCNSSFD